MSVARTPGALVLDVESCNQLVGCPGCGVIDVSWAGVPVRIRWYKRRWICREQYLPDRDLHRAEPLGVCSPGAFGSAGDPLGDPTVALRGSHYLGAGPPARNYVEYRVAPYQASPASRI